jgi:hypothetical protein
MDSHAVIFAALARRQFVGAALYGRTLTASSPKQSGRHAERQEACRLGHRLHNLQNAVGIQQADIPGQAFV